MNIKNIINNLNFNKLNIDNIEKYSNNFDIKMPFLVINCDNHKDRILKFDKSAKNINLNYYRISCIYGKNFNDKNIYEMYKNKIIANTDFINIIEVSIFFSHIYCWLIILNSNYEYGIICEDDITFKKNFINKVNKILNTLHKNNKNFDLLYLWNGNWQKTKGYLKNILKITNELDIRQETKKFNAGTVCYIISKNTIHKLLKKALPINNPVDIFIGTFYNKLNIYTLYMKYNKNKMKDISPLFISGEWDDKIYYDNDIQSTQEYDLDTLKDIILKYKKKYI